MDISVRRLTPWYLLVVLVFAVVAAASVGIAEQHSGVARRAGATPSFIPPTGFAGYNVEGVPVHQISAQFTVPAASARPLHEGDASTWIGIQQLRGSDFIQVGTTESAFGTDEAATIFWSDTQRNFHPQTLTEIKPGDVVAVSMVKGPGGWRLRAKDLTDDTTYALTVHDDATAPFDVAEYIQEDPAAGDTPSSDVPYPTVATVSFGHVLENGRAPVLVRADGTILMSPNGFVAVPTPEADDGFSVVPPQGEAARYLRVASQFDLLDVHFDYDLTRWNSLSESQQQADVNAMVTGLANSTKAVNDLPGVQDSVKKDFALQNGYLAQQLGQWRAEGLGLSDGAYRRLADPSHSLLYQRDVDEIRASLGLPPPS